MSFVKGTELWDAPGDMVMSDALRVVPANVDERRPGFKMRVRRQHGSPIILMAIAACAILLYAGGSVFAGSYDNDVWFFLATGESIIHNGIPYTNPFSIQEGLGFVAQQWLHCVISYGIYSAGGFVALGAWSAILFCVLAASLFALGVKLRGGCDDADAVMVLVALCVIAASAYASVRPHLYSMLAFTWIMWFCESYRRTKDVRWLIAVPVIVIVHVNLHAAIAPYDLLIIACYAIPDITALLHKKGQLSAVALVEACYPRQPLAVVLIVSALALLVNPYGIKGALYVFLSIGAAGYLDRINEMGRFVPAEDWRNMLVTALMFAAALMMGRKGLKRLNLPLVILAVVAVVGSLIYLRNQWISALFCFAFLAWSLKHGVVSPSKSSAALRVVAACILVIGLIGAAVLMVRSAPELQEQPVDSAKTPVRGVDALEELGVDPSTTNAFTFFNAGGYLEYRGFKVNMDPRPEIWNSSINGVGHDYYFEYVKMSTGDMSFNGFDARYDFDVYFIDSDAGTDPYFTDDPRFTELEGGDGYRVWAKMDWLEHSIS